MLLWPYVHFLVVETCPVGTFSALTQHCSGPGRTVNQIRDDATARSTRYAIESIRKSAASYASRFRLWVAIATAGLFQGTIFSATPADAVVFVGFFRNADSAAKYLEAVRWFYTRAQRPIHWDTPHLQQIIKGGRKHNMRFGSGSSAKSLAVTWPLLSRLVEAAWSLRDFGVAVAMIFAAMFLLRCKDELLPLTWGSIEIPGHPASAATQRISIRLSSRKNRQQGSVLTRSCSCSQGWAQICPVHVLGRFLEAAQRSMHGRLFDFSYAYFLRRTRELLAWLEVPDSHLYSTKAFRRGTARQMLASGSSLADILRAGQWNSSAFMLYLDKNEVDEAAIFDALDVFSDDSDEEVVPSKRRKV